VFHAKHFPHAPAPENFLDGVSQEATEEYYEEEDDGLGYYPDGTKRTLTDEQVAMFRHSEIQAILRQRRLRREEGNLSEEGEAVSDSPRNVARPARASMDPTASGPAAQPAKQQWATSSARTKARNKKNRDKYRLKKRNERLQQEQVQKEGRPSRDEDDESDEWDPWHQANGPDVQKDEAIELDY
jgi:hypothetical protein